MEDDEDEVAREAAEVNEMRKEVVEETEITEQSGDAGGEWNAEAL